ncbi:hypothetical protein B0J13DRAFT_478509 [Dactylonectria estremocensis]|uniref:Zn(2)-C6 fungal-type domain-containing protein n=1 Tax=Dactylonectria estremocensis TaxID=1079267 RepID=A0A9P9EMZ7_9HYPO|nr:hypothetical protein B0J13DRAFT_478509 [Dactylonectria estremocensis]
MASTFSPSGHFPQRRRVTQACVNCRLRKTRCDAAQPKCSLCTIQNVDCVYRDAQQLRIDHNTKVLLDRLEILEERVLSSLPSTVSTQSTVDRQDGPGEAPSFDLQIPLSHTANANHVFSWPIVSELLSESPAWRSGDATDVFFELSSFDSTTSHPPETWRLSQNQQLPLTAAQYHALLREYFLKVNVFFPLLSMEECVALLDSALSSELNAREELEMSTAQYALVLIVLCLASLVTDGEIHTIIPVNTDSRHNGASPTQKDQMHSQLWNKAKLCLGWLNSDISIPAAQCAMLASIYMGATGNVAESFFWAHSTAVKVETIARLLARKSETAPDSFRRLYWISFIYEGDFVSEISITLPSGIARYEDVIPYPDFNIQHPQMSPDHAATSPPAYRSQEELFGFQISTNAAIRRFLNRVNSVVYDNKEQYRAARANYASWLLRISDDLWSHHEAIYQNLPDILLMSQPRLMSSMNDSFTQMDDGIPSQNRPWNVIRLRGRYYAGQYIIHRPFVEFALLNISNFDSHPCKADILKKAKMCLDGCQGFVELFGTQPANSITSLFATGMAVFTMTLILMVSSVCSIFRDILPASLETSIDLGQQILARFSSNIKEFKWHSSILQRVDAVRKSRL